MPRYRKSKNKKLVRKRREFTNPYQILHFLSTADKSTFQPFQEKAKDILSGKIKPISRLRKGALQQIATTDPKKLLPHAVTDLQSKNAAVGGGVSSAIAILLKQFGHLVGFDKIQDAVFGAKKQEQQSLESQNMAFLVSQTYNDIPDRPGTVLQRYSRLPKYDTDHVSVWKDIQTNELIVSVRGTRIDNSSDLLADIGILLGKTNVKSQELDDLLDKLETDFPNQKYDIACHSLGCMYVNTEKQDHGANWDDVYFFNPGSSPAQSDSFETQMANDEQYQYFMNHGDPISANILEHMSENTIQTQTQFGDYYYSPIASHSITQWFPEGFGVHNDKPPTYDNQPTSVETAEYQQDNEETQAANLS